MNLTVNDENSVTHYSKRHLLIDSLEWLSRYSAVHIYLPNVKTWIKSLICSGKQNQTFVENLLKLAKIDHLFIISAFFSPTLGR